MAIHKELGEVMWHHCGMARTAEGLNEAISKIDSLKEAFEHDMIVPGRADTTNQALERAGRLGDFLDLAHLMCRDALERDESCGCHFREEHQTDDGEVVRNDDEFANVTVWEWKGEGSPHEKNTETLSFDALPLMTRSYK